MTIVYDKLMALDIPPREQTYTPKDCILYALGIGFGHDPMNEDELPFVYEKNLKVLPTMGTVLGHPGFWARDRDTGIDWLKVVNGEQASRCTVRSMGQGTVIGKQRIVEVIDKGAGKGALILSERDITDKATSEPIATVTHTIFCRGDGGFGGPPRKSPEPHPIPVRAPDAVCDLATRPEAALIYRLSGDPNPLHSDPAIVEASRLSAPDRARFGHLRNRRSRRAKNFLRLRSAKNRLIRRALLRSGVSGRDHSHRDVARRRGGELPLTRGRARCHRSQQRARRGGGVSELWVIRLLGLSHPLPGATAGV